MTVGEKMAEMFSWTGKTHQQVSAATGITRSTISSYTSGQSKVPLDAAYQIAEALGVTPWTLLNGEPLQATVLDLTQDEAALITDMRGLTLNQREVVCQIIRTMKEQNGRA